jgi:hypothetical protein
MRRAYDELYEGLGTKEDEKYIYKMAIFLLLRKRNDIAFHFIATKKGLQDQTP